MEASTEGEDRLVEETFRDMLKHHDYYYAMSDDHSVWKKGQAQRDAIYSMIKKHPYLKPIWDEYESN